MSDAAIIALLERNAGQATFAEYKLLHDTVLDRAPCNLLVFGVGRDSSLWLDANAGGKTIFLEDVAKWADFARSEAPDIVVHDIRYRTARCLWPLLRHFESALYLSDLPGTVADTPWDVIFVDAPRATRWYRPGRMRSVYTASVLARRSGGDVFVHDCHRRVERESSDQFLGEAHLVAQTGSMRHYRLGSTPECRGTSETGH